MVHYLLASSLAHCFFYFVYACIHSYICQTWHVTILPLIVMNDLRENLDGEWEQERKKIGSLTLPWFFLFCRFGFFCLGFCSFFFLGVFLIHKISWIIYPKNSWKKISDINKCVLLIYRSLSEANALKVFLSVFFQLHRFGVL